MLALENDGNRVGALNHFRAHEQLLREEFDVEAPTELVELAEQLRSRGAVKATPTSSTSQAEASRAGPVTPAVGPVEEADDPVVDPGQITPVFRARDHPSGRLRRLGVLGGAALALLAVGAAVGREMIGGGELADFRSASTSAAGALDRAVVSEADRLARVAGLVESTDRGTENIAAYDMYVRGSDPTLFRSEAGARQGLELYLRAIELDPGFGAAHAGAAGMYVRQAATAGRQEREQLLRQAEEAATRALRLEEALWEAHLVLGVIGMLRTEFGPAESHLLRANEIDPANVRAFETLSELYVLTGRTEEALAMAERALEADPLSATANAEAGRALAAAGRCPEALDRLLPLLAVDPPLLRAAPYAAQCLARRGRLPEALAILETGWEERAPRGQALFAYLLAQAGRTTEALRIRESLRAGAADGQGDAFAMALVAVGFNDFDEAFRWLDRAHADGTLVRLNMTSVMDPVFADLRRDPRFADFKARAGF